MEIVNIEANIYEEMMKGFEDFSQKIDSLCERHGERELDSWLDNQDVCLMLNISKRTLQTLRDNRTLSYTMIGRKTYYKSGDVQKMIGKIIPGKEVKRGK